MKKTAILGLIFLVLLSGPAFAEVSIKAEVDKRALSTDQALTYKLTVSSSEANTPKPTLPEFKGFRVFSNAQSSSVSFAQGKAEFTLTYIFVLSPVETGKLKIEPASVKVGDNTYASEAFEIEATQGKKRQPVSPKQKPPFPQAAPGVAGGTETTL